MSPPIGGPRRPHAQRSANPIVPVTVALEADQILFMRRLAKLEGRSVSDVAREMVNLFEQVVAASEGEGDAQSRSTLLARSLTWWGADDEGLWPVDASMPPPAKDELAAFVIQFPVKETT